MISMINYFNGEIDESTLLDYQNHISAKNEHLTYKQLSLQGAIKLDEIAKIIKNEPKVTLNALSQYLSNKDTSDKIIILVVTCRGDGDMTHE